MDKQARERVRKVAEGATINGTYRMSPEPALEAFRADLHALVAALPNVRGGNVGQVEIIAADRPMVPVAIMDGGRCRHCGAPR